MSILFTSSGSVEARNTNNETAPSCALATTWGLRAQQGCPLRIGGGTLFLAVALFVMASLPAAGRSYRALQWCPTSPSSSAYDGRSGLRTPREATARSSPGTASPLHLSHSRRGELHQLSR